MIESSKGGQSDRPNKNQLNEITKFNLQERGRDFPNVQASGSREGNKQPEIVISKTKERFAEHTEGELERQKIYKEHMVFEPPKKPLWTREVPTPAASHLLDGGPRSIPREDWRLSFSTLKRVVKEQRFLPPFQRESLARYSAGNGAALLPPVSQPKGSIHTKP